MWIISVGGRRQLQFQLPRAKQVWAIFFFPASDVWYRKNLQFQQRSEFIVVSLIAGCLNCDRLTNNETLYDFLPSPLIAVHFTPLNFSHGKFVFCKSKSQISLPNLSKLSLFPVISRRNYSRNVVQVPVSKFLFLSRSLEVKLWRHWFRSLRKTFGPETYQIFSNYLEMESAPRNIEVRPLSSSTMVRSQQCFQISLDSHHPFM